MNLSEQQCERYKRNTMLPEVGAEGQQKLLQSKVLVVGAGGLGSPVLLYLAAAGVGTLGIIDGDVVDMSNLQRQVVHTTERVGQSKCLSAQKAVCDLNPDIKVEAYMCHLTPENAEEIISKYDFVIDAVDNYHTKVLINDTCARMNTPFSHGAIREFEGQLFTYTPGAASYRDYYGEPPTENDAPKASEYGLFGVIAGIVGTLQAAECLKYLCGIGQLLTNRLLCVDARTMTFSELRLR